MLKRFNDEVKGFKVSGGLATATIYDQIIRPFGYIRIQVIQQHPQSRFLYPSFTIQLSTSGCFIFDWIVTGESCSIHNVILLMIFLTQRKRGAELRRG